MRRRKRPADRHKLPSHGLSTSKLGSFCWPWPAWCLQRWTMISAFERDLALAHWPRSSAEVASRGITRAHTRSRRWRRTSRGYFVPASAPEVSAGQRILDAVPLISNGGALAGWAAAYVHGADLLDGVLLHQPSRTAASLGQPADLRSRCSCSASPSRRRCPRRRRLLDPEAGLVAEFMAKSTD